MVVTLSSNERLLVDTVVWFANASPLTGAGEVERRFSDLGHFAAAAWRVRSPMAALGERGRLQAEQTRVRAWLAAIAGADSAARATAEQEVLRALRGELTGAFRSLNVSLDVDLQGGRLRIIRIFHFRTVAGACAWGTALLLDEASGLAGRLGQCGAPGCGRFQLTWTGKPRRHCSPAHAALADAADAAARQAAYRRRQRRGRTRKAPQRTGGT